MSFLFGKQKETEMKYNIFVKEKYAEVKEAHPEMDSTEIFSEIAKLWQEQKNKGDENLKARMAPYREREASFKYLEEKLNPNPENTFKSKGEKIKETRENKFEEIVKKYPNISFEEAILRSHRETSVYYTDEYFIKKFKQLSNPNLTNSSPPKPPPLPSVPKRQSPKSKSIITDETLQTAKSKLKPKPKSPSPPIRSSPPKPPPLPSSSKRSSTKKSESKSPSPPNRRSSPDPKDPNYELEMAFKNLE